MKQEKCIGVGINSIEDRIVARDISFIRDGRSYIISVCTDEFEKLLNGNGDREPYLVLGDISDIDEVCRQLAQKDLEELSPYLVLQEE